MIGVELKSWVNREQISEARKEERIRDDILKAIGNQPPNETQHIGYIWLSPKRVRFEPPDASDFRKQILRLIKRVDNNWSQEPDRDQHAYRNISEFTEFPLLEKYLDSARFHAQGRRRLETRWILFPTRGGPNSPNDMLETLRTALRAHRRDPRYKELRTKAGLDEVYLLVHYDFKAFAYNSPFDAPNFGFREAAQVASEALEGDCGYFDRIFLFHFLWGNEKVYELCS